MPKVFVVLKNGTKIEVEGADSADWIQDKTHVGATGTGASRIRLICKSGDQIIGRFDGPEVAGYAVDIR